MRKLIFLLCLLCFVAVGAGLSGCYKDVITQADPDGPPQDVSFKDDLIPIFTQRCATAGCHATGGHAPDLTADNAYRSLNNGVFVNTLIPKESRLYIMINGEMSTYIPSPVDKRKVYDWIRNGAPNN